MMETCKRYLHCLLRLLLAQVLLEIGWPLLSIVRVSQAWDAIIC
ncbi:hypothetical protein HanXRQr2_Chr15g0714301 [Helianthus annuus]|uniref:Uncharacterized protein n=1 Tax=Helianthus annuus TaxID=4232 RepID=A0A9K3H4T1_HELAN|nr:hypothetical protein HanXRQr2_Chr15g0714301 [Helianthus annuus]KAJ0833024.1 hypothetical protein HanPSC8_Chr15g0685481 [Helianthus annuus]